MTEKNKSLAEVKKMVEELEDWNCKCHKLRGASLSLPNGTVCDFCERKLEMYPLLAQTLLHLIEDNEKMRGDLEWFIGRVDKFEVRSKRTYARYKETLSSLHFNE